MSPQPLGTEQTPVLWIHLSKDRRLPRPKLRKLTQNADRQSSSTRHSPTHHTNADRLEQLVVAKPVIATIVVAAFSDSCYPSRLENDSSESIHPVSSPIASRPYQRWPHPSSFVLFCCCVSLTFLSPTDWLLVFKVALVCCAAYAVSIAMVVRPALLLF